MSPMERLAGRRVAVTCGAQGIGAAIAADSLMKRLAHPTRSPARSLSSPATTAASPPAASLPSTAAHISPDAKDTLER